MDAEQEEDDLDDADTRRADRRVHRRRANSTNSAPKSPPSRTWWNRPARCARPPPTRSSRPSRNAWQRAQFAELKDGRGKLLLFTEHRDTLNYVKEHLGRWGYTTCEIHGGMNPHERKRAQEVFRTQAQICVATEAAGEGINLQFCHLMINYDMPWNPTRLEQRLGRIHRIGQRRRLLRLQLRRHRRRGRRRHRRRPHPRPPAAKSSKLMKASLAGRVFDVIGEVLSLNDVNLPEMLREAAVDPRRLDDYLDQIDRIDPQRLAEYEQATGIALARGHVDFSGFQKQNLEVEERRLMPKYVEEQFVAGRQANRPAHRAAGRRPLADRARPGRPALRAAGLGPEARQGRQRIPQDHLPQGNAGTGPARGRRAAGAGPSALRRRR